MLFSVFFVCCSVGAVVNWLFRLAFCASSILLQCTHRQESETAAHYTNSGHVEANDAADGIGPDGTGAACGGFFASDADRRRRHPHPRRSRLSLRCRHDESRARRIGFTISLVPSTFHSLLSFFTFKVSGSLSHPGCDTEGNEGGD